MAWKIGNVTIENPFVLAPMAGVTELPFRMLYGNGERKGHFFP